MLLNSQTFPCENSPSSLQPLEVVSVVSLNELCSHKGEFEALFSVRQSCYWCTFQSWIKEMICSDPPLLPDALWKWHLLRTQLRLPWSYSMFSQEVQQCGHYAGCPLLLAEGRCSINRGISIDIFRDTQNNCHLNFSLSFQRSRGMV